MTLPPVFRRRLVLSTAALVLSGLALSGCSDSSAENVEAGAHTDRTPVAAGEAPAGTDPITTAATELPEPDGKVDVSELMEPGPLPEMAIGEEDAPVTIVEYMSMTCPHCAAFHNETFDQVKEQYVDTGKVRFVVREFPFDARAAAAIMLARCAPDDQFFPMVDVLFEQQQQWATAEDARNALLNIARLAGFTQESFEECLTNQQLLDDINQVRQRAAEEFGVSSTPTFFINGERYAGNMPFETMAAIIDSKLQ